MKARATRVAWKSDGKTLCRPSDGYDESPFDIELDDNQEIGAVEAELPASDEIFQSSMCAFVKSHHGSRMREIADHMGE